jgi:alpha-tubulin suppressor-like RCC1 family protein
VDNPNEQPSRRAFCWGANTHGELGNNSFANGLFAGGSAATFPVEVSRGAIPMKQADGSYTDTTDISAGGQHTCLVAGGATYCFGSNYGGELGNGTTGFPIGVPTLVAHDDNTPAGSPVAAAAAKAEAARVTEADYTGVSRVAAGDGTSCDILNGETACWGWNFHGEVGNGEFDGYVTKPSALAFAVDIQATPSDSASGSETPSASPSGSATASPSGSASVTPSGSASSAGGAGEAADETEPPSTAKLATTGAPIAGIFVGGVVLLVVGVTVVAVARRRRSSAQAAHS